ncbi:MAG: PAS domain S-box protein, partial [Deltaproteobacteria bacterium]
TVQNYITKIHDFAQKLTYKGRRRFSTILMITITALITLSVVIILAGLNIYFNKRVETEFQKKLHAQRGQVEILLENRFAHVRQVLRDLSYDNTIRVTLMLGAKSQLKERITRSYPSGNGVYHFVKKDGEKSIFPKTYSGISEKLIDSVFTIYPQGEILLERQRARLIWLFSSPIMRVTEPMGTAYALFDLTRDQNLIETIRQTVEGDLSLISSDSLHCLISGKDLPFNTANQNKMPINFEFVPFNQNFTISKIPGYDNLYYLSSLVSLLKEKKRVTLLMGLFSAIILLLSMIISIFLGRKMVKPLRDMTNKAIQISNNLEAPRFGNNKGSYWEFDQMSQAFNFMLTNLKEAEERSRYKELLENVDDAVYILDTSGKILDANVAAYSQTDYPPEAFFNLDLYNILPEKDAKTIVEQLNGDGPVDPERKLLLETYHIKKDGSYTPVEIHSRPIIYRGKQVILNVARDISRRIEMGKALRESEERYRSVVENSNDGIMILDDDLKIAFANSELSSILGYDRSEIEGSNFSSYLAEESKAPAVQLINAKEDKDGMPSENEYKIVGKNHEEKWVKIGVNRFQDSKGQERTVVQVQDITDQLRIEREKKELETQLIHAQKMEALGTLAGGVAHDFNNLLMGIESRVSIMRLHWDPNDPYYRHVMAIEDIVMSAANLTNQLLGLARKGKYQIRPTNLNNLVEASASMFRRTSKEIKIRTACQKKLWPAEVDRGQIEQVLLNLYVNAWHAMPDGGDLSIQTENVKLSRDFCIPHDAAEGNYVKISVTDTGIGMEQDILTRRFEPFFTTKEVGKGTGLGLASAYGIIKNHKGIIQVHSTKGKGTTFDIFLPASDAKVLKEKQIELDLVKGNGTILIVDDEEESISAEELMLKELGYDVLLARSGKEALEIYRANKDNIGLVTLDMIMPEISGKDTFEQLKQINPDIKVLLISGYSSNEQVKEIMGLGCSAFLQKPFDIFRLSQKINQVMNL